MNEEIYYHNFQDVLKFVGIDYEFEKDDCRYPFSRGRENITFGWGQILIPVTGIETMVKNKISDIDEKPIRDIKMMYQIPFTENGEDSPGIINQDIQLEWRYGKQWKYGDITKSIYEVCYWILMHSKRSNNFYIIDEDMVMEFFSYCVIPNQWGLGMKIPSHCVCEKLQSEEARHE